VNSKVADILSLILIAVTLSVALILYPELPDPMPTHWNTAGEINGYMARPWGVATLLFAVVFVFVLMKFVAMITRWRVTADQFIEVVSLYQLILVTFMCGVAVLVLLEAMGYDTKLNRMIFGGVGLLFLFIGKSFGTIPRNYLIGIRTPWTLRSDEVWDKTHRLGGRLFMLAGVLLFAEAFVWREPGWIMIAAMVLLLTPVVYSYVVYRQVDGTSTRAGAE
jgi:uncharacterized membrane protein